ncbi:MAG TPA: membrane dipeptidase [Thermoanaerobaculia bacterium]|nr:membrane dipeptidase [Thermoanaerobaculia bacterium]
MDRREFLRAGLLAGLGTLASPALPFGRLLSADSRRRYSNRTLDLVASSNVIDMLGLLTLDWDKLYRWQRDPSKFREADFRTLRASGVNVFHPAVDPNVVDAYAASRGWIAGWNRLLAAHPQYFQRILHAADLDRAAQEGKIGLLIGFQNSDHFRTAADVPLFHVLGQRVSQLTYNARNRIGTGCQEKVDTGLSEYGAQVVQAMNEVGMAIDLSHCSDRTTRETIHLSRVPVLVTHSNCRALAPHPRCKSDESIRALAARGGVMGITVLPAFVRPGGQATVENILDHFDHVIRLVGIEHVGLGSDSDLDAVDPKTGQVRVRYRVKGLQNAQRVFDLVEGLIRRGYTDEHIRLVLGGNFRRVLGEIWQGLPPAGTAKTVSAG